MGTCYALRAVHLALLQPVRAYLAHVPNHEQSQYYLAIDIPIIYFGFIGAGISLLKIILAGQSRRLAESIEPKNLLADGVSEHMTYYWISLGWSIYMA